MITRLKQSIRNSAQGALLAAFRRLSSAREGTHRLCPYLAGLYYILDGSFLWEQRAVLMARQKHWATCNTSLYSLRRGIHRLEKGMIMRPRRRVFAEGYIGETVALFRNLAREYAGGARRYESDLLWAYGTLEAYFDSVEKSPPIEEAHTVFRGFEVPQELRSLLRPPTQQYQAHTFAFGIEDFLHLTESRHSTRWYLPTPVPRETIESALKAAVRAPSACNRQAFRFYIYDDPAQVKKIASIPMGLEGFEDKVPAVVVIVGDLGAYPEPRDRHLIYIDGSLAAMSFVLALQVQGIATCCVNWPDIPLREERMKRTIGLSHSQRPVMLITLGYADPEGTFPTSCKRSMDEMRVYNATSQLLSQERPSQA